MGQDLSQCKSCKKVFSLLQHYVDCQSKKPSHWLLNSIKHTRTIYQQYQRFLDLKFFKFKSLPQSWQKLQWQGYRNINKIDIW